MRSHHYAGESGWSPGCKGSSPGDQPNLNIASLSALPEAEKYFPIKKVIHNPALDVPSKRKGNMNVSRSCDVSRRHVITSLIAVR
jgi:hypothetical protein